MNLRFWDRFTEKREQSYTDAVVRGIVNAAGGTLAGDPSSTAALEVRRACIPARFLWQLPSRKFPISIQNAWH